jgi:hypothetical protein
MRAGYATPAKFLRRRVLVTMGAMKVTITTMIMTTKKIMMMMMPSNSLPRRCLAINRAR